MAKKSKQNLDSLSGEALLKETNRRIRVAMAYWKAHNNRACRGEREKALLLYNRLTQEQKDKIPQQLRIWLRYRSVKYFGEDRTAPGTPQGHAKSPKAQSPPTKSAKTKAPEAKPKQAKQNGSKRSESTESSVKRLPHQHKPRSARQKKRNKTLG